MIYNLGSINADYFYRVPHIPQPGETLASTAHSAGLGGKGANQSVAIAKAGGAVRHIGAVGPDGGAWLDRLSGLGVAIEDVARVDTPTGHAIVTVADDGENAITLFSGANTMIPETHIRAVLADIGSHDWLVLQNETNGQVLAAECAKAKGAKIAYSAAPFDAMVTKSLLPHLDMLFVNEGEATALVDALDLSRTEDVPVPKMVVTLGGDGCMLVANGTRVTVPAPKITPVDTTAAGDTFLGYFMAAIDAGEDTADAMAFANQAAALKCTRAGTADAIPTRAEVEAYFA